MRLCHFFLLSKTRKPLSHRISYRIFSTSYRISAVSDKDSSPNSVRHDYCCVRRSWQDDSRWGVLFTGNEIGFLPGRGVSAAKTASLARDIAIATVWLYLGAHR